MSKGELFITSLGKEGVNSQNEYDKCIDRLCERFPEGGSQGVLPPHFLRATYPKIGGRVIVSESHTSEYWGLLLPANPSKGSEWTLRSFWVGANEQDRQALISQLQDSLAEAGIVNVSVYEYYEKSIEQFNGQLHKTLKNGITLGEPDARQAKQAQDLQRQVWNVENKAFLYPHDLYHPESGLATRLVATENGEVIGFLFGFYGIGKQWFGSEKGFQKGRWLESQLMGVSSEHRRKGIGKSLKLLQRELAQQEGIEVVHWTVDPLQVGNAQLNMNTLGGVAVQHYRNYYMFRNDLNRVAASRIGISWLVNSPRVEKHVQGHNVDFDFSSLAANSTTELVRPVVADNAGIHTFDTANWQPQGESVLFEIPNDWNTVQREDIEQAEAWRETTDDLFEVVLSKYETRYAITGVVRDQSKEKTYLVIQQISSHLGI